MPHPVFRVGPIRPPSECESLLLHVTQGCTWNKCKFCKLYRKTTFRAFSADSIKQDIDAIVYYADMVRKHMTPDGRADVNAMNRELSTLEGEAQRCYYMVANWMLRGAENVFLQDGNTLALQDGRLTDVLHYLKAAFPSIKRITSYGRAESLCSLSVEDYRELREAGLTRIHSGYESGSDEVLKFINKGVTAEQEIEAGKKVKAGGIELSVYFMPGVGGRALSQQNALGMARVVSEVNPDFLRIRTVAVKRRTELYEEFESGRMELCSDDEKVLELKTLIENSDCDTMLVSDHIMNLLPDIEGRLNTDKAKMLKTIDDYFALPELDRRVYQLLRRSCRVERISDLKHLGSTERRMPEKACLETPDEKEWAIKMNELLIKYV